MNNGQLNNQGGLINAVGPLLLNNLTRVTNQNGEISSAQAFTVTAKTLDNSDGKLLSNEGLTLRIEQALTNIKGLIGGANLNVQAADLNNRNGSLLGAAVTLNATALDNTANGLINSRGTLSLNATRLDTGSGGEVSAKGAMAVGLKSLGLAGGRIVGEQGVTVDFNNSDLDNRNGLILANGPLTLKNLRDLSNQGGEISSQQSFNLAARAVDNTGGKLISSQVLTLNAGSMVNSANGLMSGWQGLNVSGGSLDNRNHGTLSSRNGAIKVSLSGALQNNIEGALVSQDRLDVSAASLDNRGKGVLSSGAGQSLVVTEALVNGDGSLIESGAELAVQATTLANQATINAQQAFTFTGTDLANNGGTLASNGSLTLDLLGNLNNGGGKLVSAGPLLLQRANQVYNDADGQIASQGLLTLFAKSLDNSERGTIAGKERVAITTGAVQNHADGLIYSQDADVQLSATSLNNAKGKVQGQTGLSLNIRGDVDNQSGTLASLKGLLDAQLTAGLNNQGGIIQAQRLNLLANSINNQGGRIAAQTGDALVNANYFANANGGLYAKGLMRVSGQRLDNNAGQIAGGAIDLSASGALTNQGGVIESDSTLSATADSLDNQGGQLRALGSGGTTNFQLGGMFDNRGGRLETSNVDLILNAGGFQNQGGSVLHAGNGTFDIATANLIAAGGEVVMRGGLTLAADTWTNSSVIQAGRLTVNVNTLNQIAGGQLLASDHLEGTGDNWTNDGLIASDGTAKVTLSGNYGGNGRYSSLGNLGLGAAQLSLGSTASISAGQDSTINVSGQLNNAGRLTSAGNMRLTAGGVNNTGTLATGANLTLATNALVNSHGLISSGGDMQLLTSSFTNSYADVYGLGDVLIAKDPNQGKADLLDNRSGNIESVKNLTINAMTVNNVRDVLEYSAQEKSSVKITELPCGQIPIAGCDYRGGSRRNGLWQVDEVDRLAITRSTAASALSSGADMQINAETLNNLSSTIAATGALTANASVVTNQGVQAQEIKTTRTFWSFVNEYTQASARVANFNARNAASPSATVESDLAYALGVMWGGQLSRTSTTTNSEDSSFDAVIQAGGNVALNAAQKINNSVIRPYYAYVAAGRTQEQTGAGSGYSTAVSINAQLRPDLAQQQVNPIALPGFSLPGGQNGLFRLSGQGAANGQVAQGSAGPQNWAVSGASIDLAQRQQNLPESPARTIQLGEAAQLPVSPHEVSVAARNAGGIDAGARTANTSADTAFVLPGIARVEENVPSSSAQALNRVQGLPDSKAVSQPHKYLIETNPVLTDLKQFMSSDYLLAGLGYNPDQSAKRLGDGFYEQRLIQQAVVARTGQRFIDGQTSDEKLFKHLMDNAIASKQELNLAVGVSLSSEQVAALTHDIVWLEKNLVNGEEVLVPVLYLANANNRLAPTGALIAGNDVSLIAGQDLNNVGTLRASNNLSAKAGNDLVNSGLIEAGNRLDLLAGNTIVNKAGGIIAGRDVTMTAMNGDVINERTVTAHDSSDGVISEHTDFLNSAARIEAGNDLNIKAGRDFSNQGSVLQSGRDTTLQAGRDLSFGSVEQANSNANISARNNSSSVTQNGSSVTTGRDLKALAGRDLAVIASQVDAKRDVAMSAGGDLSLISAADEQHSALNLKKVKAQEDHVRQVSTSVKAGGDVLLSSGQDLELIASRVTAGDEAYLYAGKNLSLAAAEDTDYSYYSKTKKGSWGKKSSTMSESENDVAVSSSIDAGKKVVISAAQDINAEGAKINSGGALVATAGHDINLVAAENYVSQANASSKKSLFSSKSSSNSSSQTTLNSTELVAKSIDLRADNDISLEAAALRAEGVVKLNAGNDVEIGTAEVRQASSQSKQSGKVGVSLTVGMSASQKGQQAQQGASQSIGSDISADSLQITSGRDTAVRGSTLVTDRDLQINAGRNLEVVSAENTNSTTSASNSKKLGEVGSWWQSATGIVKTKKTDQSETTRQSGSQIASLGGDVSLTAGEHFNQIASQVVAPKGDIDIKAKYVDIEAGFDTLKASNTASTSRTAIGGTVSVPMVDALRSLQGTVQSAQQTSDGRMLALSAVNAAMSANSVLDGGQALMSKNLTGVKISVNLSDSRSHNESSQSGRNVVGSSVVAGGDVNITAKGAGADSNLNVVGSRIDAGGDANLKADGKINLLAAQNTAHQDSSNNNSGWSAGIGFSFGGQQNGFTLDLAANKGRGMSDGDDVTQTNATIKAGQTVRLDSAGDTNLKGAVVTGQQVQAKVGGDLNIESLQDASTYRSEQLSANVGVSICIPPFCAGMSSVSGGIGQQKMHSDYASVSDQSGIKARDGGFQIEVKGNTDLKGAIIASTDKAVADAKNTLTTGTLTSSDIKNKADYDATSINLSGGYSAGGKVGRDANGNVDATKTGTPVADKGGFGVNAPVALYAGDSSSSKTLSGISGAAVTITDSAKQQGLTGQTAEQAVAAINTDVSSDRDGSNKLKPIFDAKEIQVGFEITGKFVQNVAMYLESRAREADSLRKDAEMAYAKSHDPEVNPIEQAVYRQRYLDLNKQANAVAADWGAGGTYRQIATALVAGASGNVTGGGAQFAQNMIVNYVQQQGSDYIGKLVINGLKEGSPEHAGLHAILGCAGAAASNQSCSAGALGGAASSLLAGLFNETSPNETSEEREAKRNIIASMVTGIAEMSNPNGAATATNTAIANVDNNWLATQQIVQMVKEVAEAKTYVEKMKVTGKWLSISGNQDMATASALFNSFKDSMAGAGVDTLNSAVGVLRDPVASIDAMNEFILSVEGEKLFGAAAAGFKSQLTQLRDALVVGGDENAEKLGKQLGEAVALYAQVVATGGTGGAAQGASTLSKAGVEVSLNGFKEIASTTKAAGGVEGKLANFERVGQGPDLSNPVLVGGSKYVESATLQVNTTVKLSESVRLANGKVIPKDSIVTVSDDTMKIVYPDGTSELASYSKVNTPPLGLIDDAKDTASGLVSGETGVVGNGKAAANDASFDGAKATTAAGELAGAPPKNPLLDDSIPRNGDRLVVNQGPVPTCGHNSCGMVLDTLGKEVDIGSLIQRIAPSEGGIYARDVASLMTSEGVPASAFGSRNVADLARYTGDGTPVVVRIVDNTKGTDFSHFVVVDGVTTRNGISVVAIRDPHGTQYFSPVSTFQRNFSGEVVVPRSALK